MRNYSIKPSGVTHDVFDDEIVVLNLIDGKYYSMEGLAAVIWQALMRHFSSAEIVGLLLEIPGSPGDVVGNTVEQFLLKLEAEGLIIHTEVVKQQIDSRSIQLPAIYEDPVLHTFTDMQEVIALDPVHDVSEKGWPLKKDGSEK